MTAHKALGWILGLVLICFVAISATWPFMGDSSYIHYVVFLMKHGMAPYRDIFDMNMPLTYLLERIAMSLFGSGALGWRLFDFSLLGVAVASCIAILRPQGKLAGFFAGILFAVIHGQDGVMMSGERDLEVAVFQVTGVAFLLVYLRQNKHSSQTTIGTTWLFSCGLFLGVACCIKPTSIPLLLAVTLWFGWRLCQQKVAALRPVAAMLIGSAIPVVASAALLWMNGAFLAFWRIIHGLIEYHAALERKPILFLLVHAFSPILLLFALYIFMLLWRRNRSDCVSYYSLLVICAISGWIDYALQGKGFSYQRYPFLIFLLLLISTDFFQPMERSRWRKAFIVCSLWCGVLLSVYFVCRVSTYSHVDPYNAMVSDLALFGGTELSHSIQCMDTAGGCIAALYQQKIVQSTGFIYDCYFVDGADAVVKTLRLRFERELQKNPPRIFLITNSVCYSQKRSFNKFSTWPSFEQQLNEHYVLALERQFTKPVRYWSRGDIPYSYRIYVRKP